jgi:hypothetical protein
MNETTETYPIRAEFTVHTLNADGQARAKDVAKLFSVLLDGLGCHIAGTSGRTMAIVRTKLQEAMQFAVLAVAEDPENQG